tara:strand:- start:332 stop:481 length:150 start_codon:yes stop_codon:yes gene_type:complete
MAKKKPVKKNVTKNIKIKAKSHVQHVPHVPRKIDRIPPPNKKEIKWVDY